MRRPARKAKSKRATRTKKAAKAKKAAAAKKSAKTTRKATKSKTGAKKKKMTTLAGGPLGCCTLTGSGPDRQIEGITKEQCRRLAIESGKNDHWVPGQCAQPG